MDAGYIPPVGSQRAPQLEIEELQNLLKGKGVDRMADGGPKYIVDEKGQKVAVVLDMEIYRQMLECVEGLKLALQPQGGVSTAQGYKSY